jgi:hypothetical protein
MRFSVLFAKTTPRNRLFFAQFLGTHVGKPPPDTLNALENGSQID